MLATLNSFILDVFDYPGLHTIRMRIILSDLDRVDFSQLAGRGDLAVLFKLQLHGVQETSLFVHFLGDGLELANCLLFLDLQFFDLPS